MPATSKYRLLCLKHVCRLQSLGVLHRVQLWWIGVARSEKLDAYASSIVFCCAAEPDGMGSISEASVRSRRLPIPKEERLSSESKEKLLLMATVEDMVGHEIAFRESTSDGELLVFPSHLTRENPEMQTRPVEICKLICWPGRDNLRNPRVRIGHSSLFDLNSLWRNAAAYTTVDGGRCGIFFSAQDEGLGSLSVLPDQRLPSPPRAPVRAVRHNALEAARGRGVYQCQKVLSCANPECKIPFSDLAVLKRKERGATDIVCSACETRTSIAAAEDSVQIEPTVAIAQIDADADLKRNVEMNLISASGEMLTNRFKNGLVVLEPHWLWLSHRHRGIDNPFSAGG